MRPSQAGKECAHMHACPGFPKGFVANCIKAYMPPKIHTAGMAEALAVAEVSLNDAPVSGHATFSFTLVRALAAKLRVQRRCMRKLEELSLLRAARLGNETDRCNACLARLDTMFPLLEPSLLKQLVSKTDGNLWAACDELCGGDGEQARGKRARPATRSSQRRKLSAKDGFQSPEYLRAARTHLLNAFPWLWKSQVGIALPCAQYSSSAVHCTHERRNSVWDTMSHGARFHSVELGEANGGTGTTSGASMPNGGSQL